MRYDKIAIVGAGLVGSLWAILLAKRGYKVDVYEKRMDMRKSGFIGGRSINLALSDRGWKALELAGVSDKVRKDAIPMKGRMIHDIEGIQTYQPYGKENQAIYSVSRGGLNLSLILEADRLSEVNFFFNHKSTDIDLRENSLHFKNENGKLVKNYDLVFGTDGAFSSVRSAFQRTPRFNYSQHYLEHGYKELTIPPTEKGEHKIEMRALHIWPRGKFMLIALPNADGSFTCTLFLPFEGEPSFSQLTNEETIVQFFESYFPDAIPLMPGLRNDFLSNPTSTLVTVRCDPWQYGNHTLLLGDAAHAIVPFYGQGMNSGFEDCSILNDLMEKNQNDWPKIISDFNKSRIKDGNAIADLALRNFIEMRDLVGDEMFLLRKKIEAWLHSKYPNDFMPVYSMVTFSHIPYSKGLEESRYQDQLFEKILAIDGIKENWTSKKVESVFKNWLHTRNN